MDREVVHNQIDNLKHHATRVLATMALLGPAMAQEASAASIRPINKLPGYGLDVNKQDFTELEKATVSIGYGSDGTNWKNICSAFIERQSSNKKVLLTAGHCLDAVTSAKATVFNDTSVSYSTNAEYFYGNVWDYGIFKAGKIKANKQVSAPQAGASVAVNGEVDAAMMNIPNNTTGVTPLNINRLYGKLIPGEQVAIENPNIKNASGGTIQSIGYYLGTVTLSPPFETNLAKENSVVFSGIEAASTERAACVEDFPKSRSTNPFVEGYSGDTAITPTGDLGPASGRISASYIPTLEKELRVRLPRNADVECYTPMSPLLTTTLADGFLLKHNYAFVS